MFRRQLFATVMVAFGLCLPALSADADKPAVNAPADQSENRSSTVLQGGVRHSDQLPGLDETLKVGKVFSEDLLASQPKHDSAWFRIPSWYAGLRHAEEAVIVYRFDYLTGKASSPMLRQLERQDSRSGYQTDRNGGIWDYKKVPLVQHVESDLCNAVLFVRNVTPLADSDERLVVKYDEVSISLDKEDNKILQVVQQEQINTITCPQPNVLRVDVSVKSFGWDGKPQRQEQSVMMSEVVKPYEQIDTLNGQDLRPLFRDYLIAHNLDSLVPLDLVKKP